MTTPIPPRPRTCRDVVVPTEVVTAAELRTDGLLAEQRHQYLDLDADSVVTVPGAVPMCPPRPAVGGAQ